MNQENEQGRKMKTIKPCFEVVLGWSMAKRRRNWASIVMVLLILSQICLVSLASADKSSYLDPVLDPLTNAVSDGITVFIISACDSIFNLYTPEDIEFNDPVSWGIYTVATYSPNPFEFEIVKTTAQTSAVFWFVGMLWFFGYGLLLLTISKYSPTISNAMSFITKTTPLYSAKQYFKWGITGILLGLVFFTGCALTMLVSEGLTSLFMVAALPAVAPTPDNVILYCFVASLYLFMLIFFALRTLYMCLYVAFGLVIIILFIFSRTTREMAIKLTIMFFSFTFLQPVIVAITTVGVLLIHELGFFIVFFNMGLLYLALLGILVYVACWIIFGTQRIRNLIQHTERASENIIKVMV